MRWIVLVAVALLAACSTDYEGGEPAPTTSTTLQDSTTSTEIITVAVRSVAASLPLKDIVTSTKADDPNGLLGEAGQYVARVAWRDERVRPTRTPGETIGVETGGSMERFETIAHLEHRKQSIESTLGLLVSSEVLFVHGLVLLRLPGALTAPQAAEVDAALVEALGPAAAPVTPATTGRSTRTTRPRTATTKTP